MSGTPARQGQKQTPTPTVPPADPPADETSKTNDGPTGDHDQDLGVKHEGRKVFVVIAHLGNGTQQTQIVAADSPKGLEAGVMNAYGLDEDQVDVYELKTV